MLTKRFPDLVGRLKQFAQDAGLAGANVRYIVRDGEMVPARGGPSLSDIAAGRPRATVDLPFVARRIWVKNNLRIDGIERMPGATAKLQMRSRNARLVVTRDLRAREISRRLIADPMVGIPAIRARDTRAAAWYIEDFIDGRISTPADLVAFVSGHGKAVWLPAVRLRRIKRPAALPLIAALERSLASLFPPVPEDALWPVGFTHNDLKLDNLLRDATGKFWLIDWEGAGVVPLVSDLGSAYLDAPAHVEAMLAILAAADPEGRALPLRHQLALGASLALQRRAGGAAGEAKREGLSDYDALRRYEATLVRYRQAILRLAA